MKCGNYILWETVGRKKPIRRVHKVLTVYNRATNPDLAIEEGMEECDGEVLPNIDLDSYGNCSCCSSYSIEVKFSCNKCNITHSELPQDDESLKWFIQELMNGKKAEDIRKERLDYEKEQLAKRNFAMDTWRKKGIKEAKKVMKK